ncbi:MAG: hypothetical protein ACKE5Q_00095 [Methylophilaceae bacterium]
MKLSEYKSAYYESSSSASSVSRQLALAGIAFVWIFKTNGVNGYVLPNALVWPSICLIVSLGADLLHYVSGSIIWGKFHRHHELKRLSITEDPDLEAPSYFNWPAIFFFYLKMLAVLVAYGFLLSHSIQAISFG